MESNNTKTGGNDKPISKTANDSNPLVRIILYYNALETFFRVYINALDQCLLRKTCKSLFYHIKGELFNIFIEAVHNFHFGLAFGWIKS